MLISHIIRTVAYFLLKVLVSVPISYIHKPQCIWHITYNSGNNIALMSWYIICYILWWVDLGRLPGAHPAALNSPASARQEENMRQKSLQVKLKTGRSLIITFTGKADSGIINFIYY